MQKSQLIAIEKANFQKQNKEELKTIAEQVKNLRLQKEEIQLELFDNIIFQELNDIMET